MLDNFNPLYSTDEIYRGADDTRCLTDDLNAIESDVETLETSKANINHIHTEYATSNHIHSYTDLLDKPTALPASGGNADTVDGKHASDFATTDDIAAIQALVGDTPISQQVSAALSGKVDVIEGKGLSTNDYTTAERDKLANIKAGAEVNQNAFYGIKVGSNTVAADTKTDTVTFVAGNNMTITPDIVNDKITFAATDTVYTHPTYTAKDAGLYKVAVDGTGHVSSATSVAKSDITALGIPAQDTTYSTATTSAAGLMSAADKTKLDGIASGAQVNTITGVKGNAESAYRTGNVNITPANIGAAASSHNHAASNITSGTLSSNRLPTVPIAKGGTGATTVAGALANLGNIGNSYISNPSNVSVARLTWKTIASTTLPAGTYVVIGNHQWGLSSTGTMSVDRIWDGNTTYCTNRCFMNGGGGTTTAAVIVLTASTTIKYDTYHEHSAAANATGIHLYAVKIK